jgi:hypothetical protein
MKEFLKLVKSLTLRGWRKNTESVGPLWTKDALPLSYYLACPIAVSVRLHLLAAVKTVPPYIRSKIVT